MAVKLVQHSNHRALLYTPGNYNCFFLLIVYFLHPKKKLNLEGDVIYPNTTNKSVHICSTRICHISPKPLIL